MAISASQGVKPIFFNEANEEIYDPYAEVEPDATFSTVDYPEWNDDELNAEVWDFGKTKLTTSGYIFFEDPFPASLPSAVEHVVKSWQRPCEVFSDANLTVYDPSNEDFELQVPKAVANCKIFQIFIKHLKILKILAFRIGFPVESETPFFVSNTQGEPWRPWHHIYAMCKAGKGAVHKPSYCPTGKYVLRLFYMGSWRRFVVDDLIPCDVSGNCLLPVTQVPGELWPIILMKGILKIFPPPLVVHQLPIMAAFTGWTGCKITASNKSREGIWRRLILLSRKYELSQKEEKVVTNQRGSSKKNSMKIPEETKDAVEEDFCYVLANLEFPGKPINKETIVVRMNRDTPLVKANKREKTKPWKKIRWVYWAQQNGLWTDETQLPPYRQIYCINFTEEVGKLLKSDPNLESLFFDVPINEEENTSPEVDKLFQIEDWYDYNKFYDYLVSLNVYFRPSSFVSNFKVTSLIPQRTFQRPAVSGKRTGSALEGKISSKPPPPSDTFFFSPSLLKSCNEPPLLFCESTAGIFLCITLRIPSENTGHDSKLQNAPEYFTSCRGSLLVEHFDWRKPEQGEIIGATKCAQFSPIVLCLKPGRYVFKLWLHAGSPYVISVNSNTDVIIHKGPKIRFYLKNEAERISVYINDVSNAFIALIQKFGKSDLPTSLKEFYSIIKPGNDSCPDYHKKMDEFIEVFLNCILLSLKNIIPNTDEVRIMMGALQSLFFNPGIRCDLPKSTLPLYGDGQKKASKKTEVILPENSLSEIFHGFLSPKHIERVTFIQKMFRGYRVRLLRKCQTPARKEFKPYTERLKIIGDTIFHHTKRQVEVGKLIRGILLTKPSLLTTFKFHSDFQNAIDVQEYTGKVVNVEPFAWVAIARFIVVCNSDLPIPCAFHLSCNLEQFSIQGVDNDTNKEIFRLVNCISPSYYRRNGKGYTILVHGWNEAKLKTVNWRLQMVKMKYFDMLQLRNMSLSPCSQSVLPAIEVTELKNFYVPNCRGRICRCLIKIQKNTLLSLRFSTSYPTSEFMLVISLDRRSIPAESESEVSDDVVAKVDESTGSALVSSIILEHYEKGYRGESDTDHTVYVLEAYVLNSSWPLTNHEWGVIEPFRVNGEAWKDGSLSSPFKKGGIENKRRLSRISRRSSYENKPVENPFWFLQVVTDSEEQDIPENHILVEEDKSYAEYIKNMKCQWEWKDSGRRSRGNDLRMNFLYMIWLERKNFSGECEGDFEVNTAEDEDGSTDFNLLIRRMSSFSYLLEDMEPARYNISPRILPRMPTSELLYRYEKKPLEDLFKLPSTMNSDDESTAENLYFSTEVNRSMDMEEEMVKFLTQCIHYREVMKNNKNDEHKLSNQLMEEAYEDRVKAIRRLSRLLE